MCIALLINMSVINNDSGDSVDSGNGDHVVTDNAANDNNIELEIQTQVQAAYATRTPLCIIGGQSKSFYGRQPLGDELSVQHHCGIIRHDPPELVLTARAGTRIVDINAHLAKHQQQLGFEPPLFIKDAGTVNSDSNSDTNPATLGGAIAAGIAGPSRGYAGGVRDYVLGVKIVNGKGEILRFGGEVIKNVAGFDVARLMVGAMGALGVLLEISVKVIPQPRFTATLHLAHPTVAKAIECITALSSAPSPLTAAAWHFGRTSLRLAGDESAVLRAAQLIIETHGGELDCESDSHSKEFWQQLRDHRLPFFSARDDDALVRAIMPPASDSFINETQLLDWGGAQRWLVGDVDALRKDAPLDSQLTDFYPRDRDADVFARPSADVLTLYRRMKSAFDPAGILNRGRVYEGL